VEQGKPVKYREVYEHVRGAISRGEYPVGHRIPTELELQRWFNTSRITITRALRDLEQQGYLIRRRGAGSFVRDQSSGTHLLGWLIGGDPSGIFAPIYSEMTRVAEGEGFHLTMSSFLRDQVATLVQRAEALCKQYVSRRVAGMVFAPLEVPPEHATINREIAEVFDRAGIPLVLLDRDIHDYPRRSRFDLVGIANRRAGYAATEHLLRIGYRRIEFISVPETVSTGTARIAGYQDALADHGLEGDPGRVHRLDLDNPEIVKGFLSHSRAEAFVCLNDHVAAHLMQKALLIGARIPDDFAMIGFDDVDYADLVAVPLTTMRQPCARIAEAAVRALIERINHPALPTREISFECELIVRESCGARLRGRHDSSGATAGGPPARH
jgi:DNA-binding LacI/PurR family transcriptional regulator